MFKLKPDHWGTHLHEIELISLCCVAELAVAPNGWENLAPNEALNMIDWHNHGLQDYSLLRQEKKTEQARHA